jgi:hypothetical protein
MKNSKEVIAFILILSILGLTACGSDVGTDNIAETDLETTSTTITDTSSNVAGIVSSETEEIKQTEKEKETTPLAETRLNEDLLSDIGKTVTELKKKHGKVRSVTIPEGLTMFAFGDNSTLYAFSGEHYGEYSNKSLEDSEKVMWLSASVKDVFIGFDKGFATEEIERFYGVKQFGREFSHMDGDYFASFIGEKYDISIRTNSNERLFLNDKCTVHPILPYDNIYGITESDLKASKFQLFRMSYIGFQDGTTVNDFYSDPLIEKVMSYYTNFKADGFESFSGTFRLNKDGKEINTGTLENDMALVYCDKERVTNTGKVLKDEDMLVLTII